MKKYCVKKSCIIRDFIACVIINIVFIVLLMDVYDVPGIFSIHILSVVPYQIGMLFFFVIIISDRKAYVCIDEKQLILNRFLNTRTVEWRCIQRIEYKGIYKGAHDYGRIKIWISGGAIFVDTSFENYLELWETIVTRYEAAREMPCIDPVLVDVIAKRTKRAENKGSKIERKTGNARAGFKSSDGND